MDGGGVIKRKREEKKSVGWDGQEVFVPVTRQGSKGQGVEAVSTASVVIKGSMAKRRRKTKTHLKGVVSGVFVFGREVSSG